MLGALFIGTGFIVAMAFLLFCYSGFAQAKRESTTKGEDIVHPLTDNHSSANSNKSGPSATMCVLSLALIAATAHGQSPTSSSANGTADTSSSTNQSLPSAPTPAAGAPTSDAGFFTRLGRAYVADWGGHPAITQATSQDRRGTPAPIPSPPFPSSDWPIGGTPVIGASDGSSYPLMQAINQNKSREKIYGWVELGANGSTNNRGNASKGIPANWPSAYDEYPNTIQLDQAALYYERYPNTVQKDHFDWGWRLTALYGVDYRFTTAKGMLSQQLLVKNAMYGFDPVMFYTDLYFPKVAQGMNVRIGRYISLPDIEAQLAPNNYTYSHSILYTFDCYTQTGVNATVKVNNHWTVQAGLSPGCDVMPWTTDAKVTGNTCVAYTWSNGGNDLYTCANSINDGKYAYNNLAAYYETWYHKFNASWHTDTEGWYQYMRAVPNMYWYNGTDPTTGIQYANTPATPWPEAQNYRPGGGAATLNFGAVCVDPRLAASAQPGRCFAPEWAIVNYLEHNFMHNQASLNIRNEVVDDIKGQRTGTPGKYEEHMVGFDFWTGSTITFRPEVSYVHAFSPYGLRALNISPGSAVANLQNGIHQTGKTQDLILAADLIWHF
ncbi:MAG TPA: outer membrane beta-barrel protein [Acidobacteriaceae bacterium]